VRPSRSYFLRPFVSGPDLRDSIDLFRKFVDQVSEQRCPILVICVREGLGLLHQVLGPQLFAHTLYYTVRLQCYVRIMTIQICPLFLSIVFKVVFSFVFGAFTDCLQLILHIQIEITLLHLFHGEANLLHGDTRQVAALEAQTFQVGGGAESRNRCDR
jgi:hypothetical protein